MSARALSTTYNFALSLNRAITFDMHAHTRIYKQRQGPALVNFAVLAGNTIEMRKKI